MFQTEFEYSRYTRWFNQFIGLENRKVYAFFLVCSGFQIKEVAHVYKVSYRTISNYLYDCKRILKARSIHQAMYLAGRRGLFEGLDYRDPNLRDFVLEKGRGGAGE